MAEIINLRKARKQRARQDAEQAAAANRAKFGQSKVERQRSKAEKDRTLRTLAGARLGKDESSD